MEEGIWRRRSGQFQAWKDREVSSIEAEGRLSCSIQRIPVCQRRRNRRLRPISIEWPAAMLEITRPSAVPGGHWSGLSLVLNAYREKMKEKFRKISRFIDLVKRFDRAKGKSFEFRVLHRQNYSDFFHFIVNNKINKSSWIGMIELWNVIESLSVIENRRKKLVVLSTTKQIGRLSIGFLCPEKVRKSWRNRVAGDRKICDRHSYSLLASRAKLLSLYIRFDICRIPWMKVEWTVHCVTNR